MIGGVSRAGLMHKRTKHLLRAPSMRADSHCLKMWESPLTVVPLQQQSIIRTLAPQGALSFWCHCESQGIYRCLVCVVVLFIKVSGDHLEEAFHTCAVEVEVQSLLQHCGHRGYNKLEVHGCLHRGSTRLLVNAESIIFHLKQGPRENFAQGPLLSTAWPRCIHASQFVLNISAPTAYIALTFVMGIYGTQRILNSVLIRLNILQYIKPLQL